MRPIFKFLLSTCDFPVVKEENDAFFKRIIALEPELKYKKFEE